MAGYDSIWVKMNNQDFVCNRSNASDGEIPSELLEELSQGFKEAIFMEVQTTVDFFLYGHWQNGEMIREVSYCADDGWYEIKGSQESWEEILFQEEEKLRQISYLDLEHLAKNAYTTKEYQTAQQKAKQIEEIWAKSELCEGCFYPMATAGELYQIIKQYFKLPNPF